MLPPPEAEFYTRDDLLSSAQSWALGQGYVVTSKKSVACNRIQIKCDLGSANVLQEEEKDNESSYRIPISTFWKCFE